MVSSELIYSDIMTSGIYQPPKSDMEFVLYDVLDVETILTRHIPDTAFDSELASQILDSAGRFCTDILAPLNAIGDQMGCTYSDGKVKAPEGFKAAFQQYAQDGWSGLTSDVDHGGQALPTVLSTVFGEMLSATNISWSLYPRLSEGVYRCLRANASTEIKAKYLPKLAAGEWTGTMCLTEPHAGTDLGLLRTRAEPAGDGHHRINGSKIFISSGDHDLAPNIAHLVLARLPGAPSGTRGISLFVVPKYLTDESGDITGPNGVYCDAIESKLGLHGNATCTLRFENALGQLVGEPHKGLAAMFVMMNTARLGTGTQALGLGEAATQKAQAYARERLQSRAPDSSSSSGPDPIILQPDVRRMLMMQKCWVQASRMFLYWIALQIDVEAHGSDTCARQQAQDLLSLLTPVAKAFVSDNAVHTVNLGLQVHGGSGYIVDSGIEQTWRDVRILPIYEGTNGVQAYDLLARKVVQNNGKMLNTFMALVSECLEQTQGFPELHAYRNQVATLMQEIRDFVEELTANEDGLALRVSTVATDFLRLMGLFVFAYFWLRAAATVLNTRQETDALRREKLSLARFYFQHMLPEQDALLKKLRVPVEVVLCDHGI